MSICSYSVTYSQFERMPKSIILSIISNFGTIKVVMASKMKVILIELADTIPKNAIRTNLTNFKKNPLIGKQVVIVDNDSDVNLVARYVA